MTDLGAIVLGLLILIQIILLVFAIRKVLKHSPASAMPVWIMVILLFPILGAIISLVAIKPSSE